MPKAYTTGNGSILVGFDQHARVRDFYFPYVGQENHVGDDLRHRIAVRVDGETHFLADDFSVETTCSAETLAGTAVAVNERIGISLHFKDIVYNEKDILVRELEVQNHFDEGREVSVYFCQEFQVAQTTQANTAYYDPRRDVIIHYRGNRTFLLNMSDEQGSFDDYTTGVFGINGKAGSYQDAYDGSLSRNPVEHGPCDSCVSMTRTIAANDSHELHYWVAVGESIDSVFTLDQYVQEKGPSHLVTTTHDFWEAWLNRRDFSFDTLTDSMESLFRRSLLIIRSHVSDNGAIIASSDSDMLQKGKDTYNYVWPRDAAYIATALDYVGDWNIAQRFYRFANDTLSRDGYFMHKFNPDKSLGSSWHPWVYADEFQLPIQEDETGVVLHELWSHYDKSRDIEFVEELYDSLIRKAADFLIGYRNSQTGLPKASYDLWEEKVGVHTYTAASVYGGLTSAAKIARLLGKTGQARQCDSAAQKIKQAMVDNLTQDGHFIKGFHGVGELTEPNKTADVSTIYGLLKFGVFDPDHKLMKQTAEHIFDRIRVDTEVGGYARYEGDQYYRQRQDDSIVGNPWFIATLWHARYVIAAATSSDEIAEARQDFLWVLDHARSSGVLSEQIDPHIGEQLSAAPLVWSHAEYVKAIMAYEDKLEQIQDSEE